MNNKVKFLRGTSNEYAVAEKDSDTIYFTTDDGKLYIGDKEVSGDGSITIDDTLSDTSINPVQNKIVKQAIDNKADKTVATTETDGLMSAEDKGKLDAFEITTTGGKLHDKDIVTTDLIPTSLPANGGNADTVDNVHISCTNDATPISNWFAAFTDSNNLRAIDPGRAYVGNAGLLKSTLIGTAEHCTYHTILDWANSVKGMGQAVIVSGSGFPSDIPVGDEGLLTVETDNENMRKVVTFKSYGSGRGTYRRNIWSGEWRWDWQDISNAEPIKYRDITLSFNSQMSLIVPQDDMPYRFTSIDDAEHIISVIVTKCHITSPDNSIIYPYASGKNVGIKSNYANLSGTVILRAAYI